MWILRTFRSQENMRKFIAANRGNIQHREIFINNGWAIEYRFLLKIG